MIINGFRHLTQGVELFSAFSAAAFLGELCGQRLFTAEGAEKRRRERRDTQPKLSLFPMPFRLSQSPSPHLVLGNVFRLADP